MIMTNKKKTFHEVLKKLLKIFLLLTLVFSALLVYIYFRLSTERSCYDISLYDGTNIIEEVLENKIKEGKNELFSGRNIKNRLLVSYSRVIMDEKNKESFLILNYIDQITKKEFSGTIFEDCTIDWQDGHSNAYEKHMIVP